MKEGILKARNIAKEQKMAKETIRHIRLEIPEAEYKAYKKAASNNRRSLRSQILVWIEDSHAEEVENG